MTRKDVPVKEVAEEWIEGMSIFNLSIKYECSEDAIKRRLKFAKIYHPELEWSKRSTNRSPKRTMKKWIEMKGGVPGTRGVPQGSIVKKGRPRTI